MEKAGFGPRAIFREWHLTVSGVCCTIQLVRRTLRCFSKSTSPTRLAIYDQVVRQIKFAVAGGVLKEGELVPSVSELARELTINPNTVARAYRQLQDDGMLTSVRGTGLAVAAGAAGDAAKSASN